jgi:hypothetical protein
MNRKVLEEFTGLFKEITQELRLKENLEELFNGRS